MSITLSKAIEGYFINKAGEYAEATLDIYRWGLELMKKGIDDKPIEKITKEEIQKFYQYVQSTHLTPAGKKLSPASIDNVWISVRSFFNWAENEGYIKSRPDSTIKRPKYKPAEISPFSPEEIKAMLKACKETSEAETSDRRKSFKMHRHTEKRDIAMILLLLDTGLRASEVTRLTLNDINLETGDVFIAPFSTGRKTKSRHVFMGKATRRAVWHYLNTREDVYPEDPLFMSQSGKPMNRTILLKLIRRLGERAGVKNAHPHRFRHTFAIQFLRNGGDVFTLQRLLGHATLEMVRHYVAVADTDTEAAHRKASPVDRWHL